MRDHSGRDGVGFLGRLAAAGLALLVVAALGTGVATADCDCTRLPTADDCPKRCIDYYIELPPECRPASLSLIDVTTAAVVWDRTIWTQELFESLDEASQRRVLQNDPVVGVESGRLYTYRGPNGTEITIARREGDPTKWIFQLCSCCHAIPTLQIGLDCPGTQTASRVIVGLTFDERNQYVMRGQVLVNGREITRENYNSFFRDCSVPYCYPDERATYDSPKGNGWISLTMPPDPNCKINLDEFREDLCAALAAAGCRCDIRDLDARSGSLRGYIRTNRCTPEVVACIEQVLKRHTHCKQVTWIGRKVMIRPRPSPTGRAGVMAGLEVGVLGISEVRAFLLQELEKMPLPPEVREGLASGIAGLPDLVPLPLAGVSLAFPLPIGALDVGGWLLTDGMLRGVGIWPPEGVELSPGLSVDFQLAAWRLSFSWGLGLELGLLAARCGLGVGAFGGNFLPAFYSPDPEVQGLLPELCPDAFRWLAAGPVLWAGLELGPPFLRLALQGEYLLPLVQAPGAAGVLALPGSAAVGLTVRF